LGLFSILLNFSQFCEINVWSNFHGNWRFYGFKSRFFSFNSILELDLITIERKRELWECENFLKGEKDEMIDIYENKGLNRETASTMVDLMSENKQAFVDVMMVQELGLKPVVDPWGPLKVFY
jgi:hypothetical protein